MDINTSTEIVRQEKSNNKPYNHHIWYQLIRIHIKTHIIIIQGKTTRRRTYYHKKIPWTPLTTTISKHHQNVEISLDLFFVNGGPFLHTKPRKTDFRPVQACNSRWKFEAISGLNKVNTKYQYRGFTINDYHGDN